MRVEQVTGPDAHYGEGPVWDGLRWVDMLAGDLLSLDPTGTVQRWHVGSVAAAMRPRRGGGWCSDSNAASRSSTAGESRYAGSASFGLIRVCA